MPPSALTLDSRCEVWRDGDGKVLAYAESLGDEYLMHFPGLASYRFSSRSDEIAAIVANSASEELVRDAYRRRVLPMALQVCGREVMHASAVRAPAGVAALCADSETGKSTTAFGLSNRGYPLWADDLVAFEISNQLGLALSLPFNLRLRPAAAALFERASSRPLTAAVDENASPGQERAPLAAVFVLRRGQPEDPLVAVKRLSLGEAFAAVLAHAWSFGLQDAAGKRRMIQNYLDLVAGTPVFDVCFQSGLENLPTVLDAIEKELPASAGNSQLAHATSDDRP